MAFGWLYVHQKLWCSIRIQLSTLFSYSTRLGNFDFKQLLDTILWIEVWLLFSFRVEAVSGADFIEVEEKKQISELCAREVVIRVGVKTPTIQLLNT